MDEPVSHLRRGTASAICNILLMGLFDDLILLDAEQVRAGISMRDAIEAVQASLRGGFDPDDDPARAIVDVRGGQLLLMPADLGRFAGQKLGMVAPGNPARGLERIQAVYVLLDAETLSPVALLDGTELTSIRTPAVSAAAVDAVARPDAARLVVLGSGPQAVRHVEAMAAVRPIRDAVLVGRDRDRTARAVDAASGFGVAVRAGAPADVEGADLIVCATTAREPLFDDRLVSDTATVVAIGSHEADARELPGPLLGRSQVVVETRRVATTEAGDVIMAIAEGHVDPADLVTLRQVIVGEVAAASDRPRIIKTCGMGWQDLAVASLLGGAR
ncbi:MAG: ornithine cyclodeaminase family protein [Agrococcus sp.]